MFEDNDLKLKAWKKTGLLMTSNISDKDVCALAEYIMQLSQKETEVYVDIAQKWYDRRTISKSRRIKITPNAAELIGKVRATPIMTETIIPIIKGCCSVAHIIIFPKELAALPIAGAHQRDNNTPTQIVTKGVTIISILVSFFDFSKSNS